MVWVAAGLFTIVFCAMLARIIKLTDEVDKLESHIGRVAVDVSAVACECELLSKVAYGASGGSGMGMLSDMRSNS